VSTPAERPWLDTSKSVEERVDLLVAEMTVAEKVGQLHQPANISSVEDAEMLRAGGVGTSLSASGPHAGNVRDEGVAVRLVNEVQRLAVEESRLGIPLLIARDVIHGHRTMLPIPLGLAATWDADLIKRGARMAAVEASAVGINWTFTPMMDITGDHRWGRVAESLGEDPLLAGRLAVAMIEGFQTDDLTAPDAIAATAKHFVGYGLAEGGRDYNTVGVGENSLRNLQLRPFHDCTKAGVATVMASFNDLDGVPAHGNRHYLRDLLKDEWDWDGAIVSDWNGVGELVEHRVAPDLADAARQAMDAGVDMDMVSRGYTEHLADLVESGQVPIEQLDDAVRRVLRLKFRCGIFEHPYTDEALESQVAACAAHQAVARDSAAASLVLLTNDGTLPLQPESLGNVLLTGPLFEATDPLFGTWTLDGRAEEVVTIATAMADQIRDRGLDADNWRTVDWNHADEVLWQARHADTVIAFVGEHPCRSGEANSITTLELPAGQLAVLQGIVAMGKRLVVVVLAGRPLGLEWMANNAAAVLWAWHPGGQGGPGITDVLFGDCGPRGRLPVSFPRTVGQVPLVYNHRSTGRPIPLTDDAERGRYMDSLSTPLFPFGHGLTYGSVEYSSVTLSTNHVMGGQSLTAAVTVRNTAPRACTEVVQCYVRDEVADVTRPVRELLDYRLVQLDAGAEQVVDFTIEMDQLAYYDRAMTRRVDPGHFALWIAADSASGTPVTFELT
jgi:beta-glucosidase